MRLSMDHTNITNIGLESQSNNTVSLLAKQLISIYQDALYTGAQHQLTSPKRKEMIIAALKKTLNTFFKTHFHTASFYVEDTSTVTAVTFGITVEKNSMSLLLNQKRLKFPNVIESALNDALPEDALNTEITTGADLYYKQVNNIFTQNADTILSALFTDYNLLYKTKIGGAILVNINNAFLSDNPEFINASAEDLATLTLYSIRQVLQPIAHVIFIKYAKQKLIEHYSTMLHQSDVTSMTSFCEKVFYEFKSISPDNMSTDTQSLINVTSELYNEYNNETNMRNMEYRSYLLHLFIKHTISILSSIIATAIVVYILNWIILHYINNTPVDKPDKPSKSYVPIRELSINTGNLSQYKFDIETYNKTVQQLLFNTLSSYFQLNDLCAFQTDSLLINKAKEVYSQAKSTQLPKTLASRLFLRQLNVLHISIQSIIHSNSKSSNTLHKQQVAFVKAIQKWQNGSHTVDTLHQLLKTKFKMFAQQNVTWVEQNVTHVPTVNIATITKSIDQLKAERES